jgi:hypothetical protein
MISSAAHPRWPLQPPSWILPSWIWFPSIFNWSNFWWLIGGDWRKVPFDDHIRHSSKTAAMPAILDFLTNAWVDWSDFLVAHWGQLEEGSFR